MRTSARLAAVSVAALVAPLLVGASAASSPPAADQTPIGLATGDAAGDTVDLDVLYVGAHPDDEAFALATFGQWNEYDDLRTGVITITRGEGGGNAVGLEEGPELGILREAEERRAVSYAGIEHIYNLDQVDVYYTLSAPLHARAWDGDGTDDTLERVVRVVRATRPEVIITMNPSPTPGNHGGHQQAARLAVEAYYAAADADAFPDQLAGEGLEPWAAGRILRNGASGSGVTGSACETTPYEPDDPTDRVFGTWQGRMSDEAGESWAMLARRGQWEYASQGWATFPPPPDDPEELDCNWFTLIDSRTSYPDPASGGTAAVQGAALPVADGLPRGTELEINTDRFAVLPGTTFEATVRIEAGDEPLVDPQLEVAAPDGWTVEPLGEPPAELQAGEEAVADVAVTPAADADVGERFTLAATLTTDDGATGTNETAVETVHEVHGRLSPRPEIADFNEWTREQNLPKLETLIAQTVTLGSGRTEEVVVDVANDGDAAASGSVALDLADGFEASPAEQPFTDLGAGASTSVTFAVTNTDTALPTSSNAEGGGYPFQVRTTTFDSSTDVQDAMIELVPTSTVPQLDVAPVIDGVAGDGEYPGDELDASTYWEGEETGAGDVSAVAKVSFTDEALYVFIDVTDDELGTVLTPDDCKRHWRTDSIELTIDPRGTSQNASTAFKTGIFPITDDPENGNPPCYERDADNAQGPGEETAPGVEVASVIREPYDGYTIEAEIPYADLPDTVDPERLGFNVLVYDSDSQDRTGQTRLGWSTFGGIQANPYGWGQLTLPGLAESEPRPVDPLLPTEAALSVESPQSIAQSAGDGVPLGGGPGLGADALRIEAAASTDGTATVTLATHEAGTANVFVWDGERAVGAVRGVEVGAGTTPVDVPLDRQGEGSPGDVEVLVALMTDAGTAAASRIVG